MRRLTASGSAPTSMPPTSAVPDVGLNSPQSMRMVVDLPAPLLPRKPKISPRADVERDVVDGDEIAEAPGQVFDFDGVRIDGQPALRCARSWPTARSRRASANRIRERPRAIELGLQHARARASSTSVLVATPALKRSPTTRRASVALRTPVLCRGHRGAARIEHRASRWRTSTATGRVEIARGAERARRVPAADSRILGAAAAAVPERPRDIHADRSHDVVPVVDARERCADSDARNRKPPPTPICGRAACRRRDASRFGRHRPRSSSARRSGRCRRARCRSSAAQIRRRAAAAPSVATRLDATFAGRTPRRRGRSATATSRWRCCASMARSRCTGFLRLGREHVVRRDEPLRRVGSARRATCASMLSSDRATTCSVSRAVTRAQKARVDLETQIGTRSREILRRWHRARRGRRVRAPGPATGVDRPLQVEPRPEVIGDVGIDDAKRQPGAGMPNSST